VGAFNAEFEGKNGDGHWEGKAFQEKAFWNKAFQDQAFQKRRVDVETL